MKNVNRSQAQSGVLVDISLASFSFKFKPSSLYFCVAEDFYYSVISINISTIIIYNNSI